MKRVIILFLFLGMIFVSGCINTSETTKNFTYGKISFSYPASWEENTNANNLSKKMEHPMFEVLDPVDNSIKADVIDVGKAKSLDTLVNFYRSAASGSMPSTTPATGLLLVSKGGKIISENTTIINGLNAHQMIVESNDRSSKEIVVFIETPGQQYYEIVCSSNPSIFDKQKANFNIIINSFQAK